MHKRQGSSAQFYVQSDLSSHYSETLFSESLKNCLPIVQRTSIGIYCQTALFLIVYKLKNYLINDKLSLEKVL